MKHPLRLDVPAMLAILFVFGAGSLAAQEWYYVLAGQRIALEPERRVA